MIDSEDKKNNLDLEKKLELTTYLAGPIEEDKDSNDWRQIIKNELKSDKLLIYCPIENEANKVQQDSKSYIKHIAGLKRAGKWKSFMDCMNSIWLGGVKPSSSDLLDILKLFRFRRLIDGNSKRDIMFWGDYEGVARSDFIIAYIKKDIRTIGTIGEIFLAVILNIPVYLIIDEPKTECNSTLIYWVLWTSGEIFYNVNECIKFIKEKYKI